MKNLFNSKKLNNKGFSLVELIIVIAIMAVLIGVLAPQYLKYVERSRVSTDLDTISAMMSATEVYFADPDHNATAGTITCSATGAVTTTGGVTTALTDAGLPTAVTMRSNDYGQVWTITFAADGTFSFGATTTDAALAAALGRN